MKMKNTMLFALMILAVLPASAQETATPNCSMSAETATALAEEYSARVDGLLRDAHARLRSISESVEAGSINPERAEKLKFAVTRDTISRLDTLSAVYDVRLDSDCATDKKLRTHSSNATVSVEELKSEAASHLETARGGQSARNSNGAY
jgi:hypothetical protein